MSEALSVPFPRPDESPALRNANRRNLLGIYLNGGVQLGDGRTLNALALWPFWGTAIAVGAKKNETRSWSRAYTGPLAIYQTKSVPDEAREAYDHLIELTGKQKPFGVPHPQDCPLGAVVAVARVVTVVQSPPPYSPRTLAYFWNAKGEQEQRLVPPLDEAEKHLGDYHSDTTQYRYAWILTDVYVPPTPVAVPNDGTMRQGIFRLADEVALPLLRDYRAFLIGLRPKCRYCGCPVGTTTLTEQGEGRWRYNRTDGWLHVCPQFGPPPIEAARVLAKEDIPRLPAFGPGDFPIVPDAPSSSPSPPQAQTMSLF